MAEGMRLLSAGHQFEAATQFYKVLQIDPGNRDAERMGYVACELIAIQRMRDALEVRTASEAQRADAKRAALDKANAAPADATAIADARTAVEQALAMNPGDADLTAAIDALKQRQGAIARGAAERRETQKRASLAEQLDAGQHKFDAGDYAGAVKTWEALLASDPTRSQPQYYQAEESIRNAKDRMKSDSRKAYAAGLAAAKSGDLLTARTQLAETVRIDPYNDAAAAKLAEVRQMLKEKASDIYKEARVREDLNQTDEALALYHKALTYVDDPSDPLAQKAQGRMNALLSQ
jgi:hypothetical protein